MIRYVDISSYKSDHMFSSLSECLVYYSKLILDDYGSIVEVDMLLPWDKFNGGFALQEIPKGFNADGISIKLKEFVITSTGIMIQATIKK